MSSYPNIPALLGSTILLLWGGLRAEVIDIEIQADHRIDQKVVTERISSGGEVQVKGVYLLPRFDRQTFKILRYEMDPEVLAMGFGWTPYTFKMCTSSISVGFGGDDNSLIKSAGDYTIYGFKPGSILMIKSPPRSLDLLVKAPDRLYGKEPLEISFWLVGGGAGNGGSGMGYVYWGRPKIHIRLEKLDSSAPDPVFSAPETSRSLSFSLNESETGADRLHPSLFAEGTKLPPDLEPGFPISWKAVSPKVFEGEFYGFSGYHYKVMRSSDFIEKEELQAFDGEERRHSVRIDASNREDDKNFFWIEETPIPEPSDSSP